ncbi:Cyclic AMP-responsive element-binding protein 5 [Fragariocoptes setiger]|uniref:Cyclic AMP-responsive element-binding protein 5 n=1 Tax=Fragariocoptes setiger TaxID=1670756 RepID=A0ABQ7SBZ2_9ACAR|nr:Cyclic AMP-responsive element-binding protein 5 [Fragariocoptes setiger]
MSEVGQRKLNLRVPSPRSISQHSSGGATGGGGGGSSGGVSNDTPTPTRVLNCFLQKSQEVGLFDNTASVIQRTQSGSDKSNDHVCPNASGTDDESSSTNPFAETFKRAISESQRNQTVPNSSSNSKDSFIASNDATTSNINNLTIVLSNGTMYNSDNQKPASSQDKRSEEHGLEFAISTIISDKDLDNKISPDQDESVASVTRRVGQDLRLSTVRSEATSVHGQTANGKTLGASETIDLNTHLQRQIVISVSDAGALPLSSQPVLSATSVSELPRIAVSVAAPNDVLATNRTIDTMTVQRAETVANGPSVVCSRAISSAGSTPISVQQAQSISLSRHQATVNHQPSGRLQINTHIANQHHQLSQYNFNHHDAACSPHRLPLVAPLAPNGTVAAPYPNTFAPTANHNEVATLSGSIIECQPPRLLPHDSADANSTAPFVMHSNSSSAINCVTSNQPHQQSHHNMAATYQMAMPTILHLSNGQSVPMMTTTNPATMIATQNGCLQANFRSIPIVSLDPFVNGSLSSPTANGSPHNSDTSSQTMLSPKILELLAHQQQQQQHLFYQQQVQYHHQRYQQQYQQQQHHHHQNQNQQHRQQLQQQRHIHPHIHDHIGSHQATQNLTHPNDSHISSSTQDGLDGGSGQLVLTNNHHHHHQHEAHGHQKTIVESNSSQLGPNHGRLIPPDETLNHLQQATSKGTDHDRRSTSSSSSPGIPMMLRITTNTPNAKTSSTTSCLNSVQTASHTETNLPYLSNHSTDDLTSTAVVTLGNTNTMITNNDARFDGIYKTNITFTDNVSLGDQLIQEARRKTVRKVNTCAMPKTAKKTKSSDTMGAKKAKVPKALDNNKHSSITATATITSDTYNANKTPLIVSNETQQRNNVTNTTSPTITTTTSDSTTTPEKKSATQPTVQLTKQGRPAKPRGRRKRQVSSEELAARKNRSKERNRVAAKRCRQKRKLMMDDLKRQIRDIELRYRLLENENIELKRELEVHKNLLLTA